MEAVAAGSAIGASTAVVEDPGPSSEAMPAKSTPAVPSPGAEASPSTAVRPAKPKVSHAHRRKVAVGKIPTEPVDARLQITRDSWAYARPSPRSQRLKRIHARKYVHVTALTPYYLRVELADGRTAYVDPEVVRMVLPADKILTLSDDSPVRERPNKWGKQLAEVNKGHHVQVVGVAPGYVEIRMRSGLRGFIPYSVLEGGAASVPQTEQMVN
jgi:hypothetical protein